MARSSLITSLSPAVDLAVRERGADYFTRRRVKIHNGSPNAVGATVSGTRRYSVTLERHGDELRVFCSCPYFQSYTDPCKHVWATLLAASDARYLSGSGEKPPKRFSILMQGRGLPDQELPGSHEDPDDDTGEPTPANALDPRGDPGIKRTLSRIGDRAGARHVPGTGAGAGAGAGHSEKQIDIEEEDEAAEDEAREDEAAEDDAWTSPISPLSPRALAARVPQGWPGRARPQRVVKRDWRALVARLGERESIAARTVRSGTGPSPDVAAGTNVAPFSRRPSPGALAGKAGEILYVVDVAGSLEEQGLVVEVLYHRRLLSGSWSKARPIKLPFRDIPLLPDAEDRRILSILTGARSLGSPYQHSYYAYDREPTKAPTRYRLPAALAEIALPMLCRTGRCGLRRSPAELDPSLLQWEDGLPWEFWLEVRRGETGREYELSGGFRRGEERLPLAAPALLIAGGFVFLPDRAARLDDHGAFPCISFLRRAGTLTVPARDREELLAGLMQSARRPPLDLPEDLRCEELRGAPRPHLRIRRKDAGAAGQQRGNRGSPGTRRSAGLLGPPGTPRALGRERTIERMRAERLRAELSFEYEGAELSAEIPEASVLQADRRRVIVRDVAAEQAAMSRLGDLGFRRASLDPQDDLELPPHRLPRAVRTLLEEGWRVEAEGQLYRKAGGLRMEVTSGIDWFELHGSVEFGDQTATLPQLLAALKRGESMISLGDGSFGLLPEEWLRKYAPVAGMGESSGDHVRFERTQVGLLDALLAAQPETNFDETFARARSELLAFKGVHPMEAPPGFTGTLRPYQRDGLGWLHFLQQFGFGGCLADDMGLGKTVQVLALLETRRRVAGRRKPSLIVVPRSLVFNWKQEAERFTPELRVLDHTGAARAGNGVRFRDCDVVLTTYGTIRRDAAHLRDVTFDYVILDESQAIKNADTQSAKAVRLLRGDHRLALSGTPIENHLGELWSLFEFLNPGMLGAASAFSFAGAAARDPDPQTRELLSRALRPFILRRTKEQVAKDLPPKLEQTLYCELEPQQRTQYDELREHYRRSLVSRIDEQGIRRSKIQILEALLRLRQVACHPGLMDKSKTLEPAAKLDVLLPRLKEILEEGHKALVFSQFTSLLAIVRERLDREGTSYAYLDGATRDRASVVTRFQEDPACQLFLISLKAGGLGLNLTAADYVFLLDPWWNPAVEAQAIDRAHRIGQSRHVFAFRLVARDTVEEKILELQRTKRDLADAIIREDDGLIRTLNREDLELLLS